MQVNLSGEEMRMVVALQRNCTRMHYSQVHYCTNYKVMVDKKHMERCDLLNPLRPINRHKATIDQYL